VAAIPCEHGGDMANAERESIPEAWGQSPQVGPGAGSGSGGEAPLKLKEN